MGLKQEENICKKLGNLRALESTLVSFVGYENEWLITPAANQKMSKKELIQVIKDEKKNLKIRLILQSGIEHSIKTKLKGG